MEDAPRNTTEPQDDGADRSQEAVRPGRLVAMGILQIILGGLSVLFVLVLLAIAAVGDVISEISQRPGPTLSSILSSLLVYVVAAFFFFMAGYGSLKGRRWVRPIVLSVMWPSLVFGVAGVGITMWTLPSWLDIIVAQAAPGINIPAALITVILLVTLVTLVVIAVVIPAAHVFIYQGTGLKQTLEALDPKTRWTDRCPTSVLGIVITVACVGLMQLSMLSFGVTWMFGAVLVGRTAYVVCLSEAAVALVIARLVYRMTPAGWWAGLGYLVFVCMKYAVTFLFADIADMYQAAGGFSKQQLAEMSGLFEQSSFTALIAAMWGISGILAAGYLLAVRKHFRRA